MAAGATGDKEGHTASAKMIKTVLESGGGLPAPSSNGGHKATFDQQLFRKALDNSNRAVWTQMLADNPEMMRRVLQQAQGSSVTIDELTEAGRSQTQQGRSAIVPWIEKEAVGEPLSTRSARISPIVAEILWICVVFDIVLKPSHVRSERNVLCWSCSLAPASYSIDA